MKTLLRTVAAVATAVVVLISNPTTSKANGGGVDKNKTTITDEQVSVKYQGVSNNNIVFKVEFENPTAEKFYLIIKNDNGDVVYHQQFTGAHFSKSVYFQNTDTDIQPTFIIRSANNSEVTRQFSVTRTLTENTVVTKL